MSKLGGGIGVSLTMRFYYLVLFALYSGLLSAQTSEYKVSSQLFIQLYPYKQNGIQKASAMASHAPQSVYKNYKKRFDYIILNSPQIHQKTQADARKKLFDLYPDTLALKSEYKRLLIMDSTLSKNILALMDAIDAKGTFNRKTQFTKDQYFEVASRFFLIDSISPKGKIQTHICIGINGQEGFENHEQFELLAAFCYESIFLDFEKENSVVYGVFEETIKAIKTQLPKDKKQINLALYQQLLFQEMARNKAFQEVLLMYYNLNKDNLPFELL